MEGERPLGVADLHDDAPLLAVGAAAEVAQVVERALGLARALLVVLLAGQQAPRARELAPPHNTFYTIFKLNFFLFQVIERKMFVLL